MKRELTEDERNRTVWILYKPYHWEISPAGNLMLVPDMTEYEKMRTDIFKMLLDKGVPEDQISKDMIEKVIERAESYVIEHEMSKSND